MHACLKHLIEYGVLCDGQEGRLHIQDLQIVAIANPTLLETDSLTQLTGIFRTAKTLALNEKDVERMVQCALQDVQMKTSASLPVESFAQKITHLYSGHSNLLSPVIVKQK